jgi:hypothetical protein
VKNKLLATLKAGFVSLLLAVSALSPVGTAFADPGNNNGPNGNNGTLKVHEYGTASGTENNDPKVCAFNLEGFGFDVSQTGYLVFTVQGGDGPTGVATGPYSFGPADATGFYASQYFNVPGGPVVQNGHYKVTLYGKDKGNGTYDDEKAKSKVFKVECQAPNTQVTPTAPFFNDVCESAYDTYTIFATTGVDYKVGGVTKPAATYLAGSNSVTVTAVAQTGYVLTGTTSWTYTYTYNVSCSVPATPAAATFYEACGTKNDTYTIPLTTGVDYQVGGATKANGSYAGSGTVTVTAIAQTGYVLTGTTTWTHTFTNIPCTTEVTPAEVTFNEACGILHDKFTIPTKIGVVYKVGSITLPAGTYPGVGTVTVKAFALPGFTLTGTTSWTHTFDVTPCYIQVTPGTVTFNDACGTDNDTYTIPVKIGVVYKVNGSIKTAGSHKGHGTLTVTAYALPGFVLTGTTSWTHTFDVTPCPSCLTKVTPGEVKFADACGTDHDTYTIPTKTGVVYRVGNQVVPAGTYNGTGTVTVTAVALPGFDLNGTTSWSNTFDATPCPTEGTTEPVVFTEACGTANDTYTIPSKAGVVYKVNGKVVTAGTYAGTGTVTVTAEAAPGYILSGDTTWTHDFTNEACPVIPQVLGDSTTATTPTTSPAELVNTGSAVLVNLFVGLFLVSMATVLTFVGRKSPVQTSSK